MSLIYGCEGDNLNCDKDVDGSCVDCGNYFCSLHLKTHVCKGEEI